MEKGCNGVKTWEKMRVAKRKQRGECYQQFLKAIFKKKKILLKILDKGKTNTCGV